MLASLVMRIIKSFTTSAVPRGGHRTMPIFCQRVGARECGPRTLCHSFTYPQPEFFNSVPQVIGCSRWGRLATDQGGARGAGDGARPSPFRPRPAPFLGRAMTDAPPAMRPRTGDGEWSATRRAEALGWPGDVAFRGPPSRQKQQAEVYRQSLLSLFQMVS